jgi:hypothetical protein
MMPVPSHLVGCVAPRDSVVDETPLIADVRCPCGSTKFDLLFPGQTHVFQGEVCPCNDTKQAALPRPPLTPWKCLDCGATSHETSIHIQTEGKEDFISESGGKFDEDKWPEGFGCLSMAIKCSRCDKQTPEWICCETM